MPLISVICLVMLAVSVLAAKFGSELIDFFYRREPETLSYPATQQNRSRYRRLIIGGGLFAYAWLVTLISQQLAPGESLWFVAGRLILGWAMLVAICTDFEQQVIYDKFLLPFAVVGLLFAAFGNAPLYTYILASIVGFASFLVLAVVTKGGIGGGDIKLMAALGLWCGDKLTPVIIVGFVLAGIIAALLLVTGQKKRREFFAYGPYFAFAAMYMMAAP